MDDEDLMKAICDPRMTSSTDQEICEILNISTYKLHFLRSPRLEPIFPPPPPPLSFPTGKKRGLESESMFSQSSPEFIRSIVNVVRSNPLPALKKHTDNVDATKELSEQMMDMLSGGALEDIVDSIDEGTLKDLLGLTGSQTSVSAMGDLRKAMKSDSVKEMIKSFSKNTDDIEKINTMLYDTS